jgi:hypothetical protein
VSNLTTEQKAERYDKAVAWIENTWLHSKLTNDAMKIGMILGRRQVYDLLTGEADDAE